MFQNKAYMKFGIFNDSHGEFKPHENQSEQEAKLSQLLNYFPLATKT